MKRCLLICNKCGKEIGYLPIPDRVLHTCFKDFSTISDDVFGDQEPILCVECEKEYTK
jgi:hypothetical protein